MKQISKYLKTTQGMFLIVLGALIIGLFAYYFFSGASDTPKGALVTIPVSATDHVRGAQAGKVTMVEFGDFQCPACGAYEPLVRQVVADNKDTLKIVFKHFPLTNLHQNALLAAKASEAAGLQGKFWEMHDILYDSQKDWSGALNAKEMFTNYAKTIGLNTAQFAVDIENKSIEAKILAEYKEGITLGVEGTPSFFINGKKIDSPQSLVEFDKIIKDAAK